VLRQWVNRAGWWVWASTVGWAVGWAAIVAGTIVSPEAGIIASLLAGLVLGIVVGIAQWLVLRQWVHQAGWWVLASLAGWTIGLGGLLGVTVVGAVVGAVTGFALDWLLRQTRDELLL
jgi:hypothetical protein